MNLLRMRGTVLANVLAVVVLVAAILPTPAQDARLDAYLDAVLQAEARSATQDWAAAAPLWERAVAVNPDVAGYWYALGTARHNAGEYRKAIPPLEKALELGARYPRTVAYYLARAHALSGEKEAALKRLDQALDLGFRSREQIRTDEAFAALRDDPTFKALAGVVDTSRMSRTEGWRHDISLLEREVKRMHHAPFRKVPRAEFEGDIRKLQDEVPKLTDHQVTVRLMAALRKIGDGHTGIMPDLIRAWDQTVPLQFGLFREGLFVIAAEPRHAGLVGAQVLRVGDHTPEQVMKALAAIVAQDNTRGVVRATPNYLRYPQVLNGLGLQSETDGVKLTVRAPDGKQEAVTVAATRTDPEYNRIIGHPRWPAVHTAAPGPLPTYLKDRHRPYRFEPLDDKTVYFQFNVVTSDPAEPLDRFLGRLFRHIEENGVQKLIIDLRWNNGGNTLLLPTLVRELVRARTVNRRGHLFVIIGRHTFSAGMNAASYIERDTEAIFVGEPTPSSPNFVGESNILILPYTRVGASISDIYWQGSWPNDHRTWIAPLLPAPPSFEAYKAGRDPAMEAIRAYRERGPAPAGNPPPAGKSDEEVRKLEREWLDAYEKRDAAAMDRVVADDFTITFPNGSVQTKPQLMAEIRQPRKPTESAPKFSTENVKARVYGDTVVLTGKVVTQVRRGDKDVREQSRYTDTYVKKDGRWQVVASHLSNVAEPKR